MKSALTLATVTLVALIASAQPADANILDWMHEWSGPGPSDGEYPVIILPVCKHPIKQVFIEQNEREDPPCFFFDFRRLETDSDPAKNNNFPVKVDSKFFDVGRSWRVRVSRFERSIEAGIGAGIMVASGDKTMGGKTTTHFTVTAPRLVAKPIVMIAELIGRDPRWHGVQNVLKIYVGGTVIFGLDAEDLVNGPAPSFHRKAEYVLSRGLVFDFSELFF